MILVMIAKIIQQRKNHNHPVETDEWEDEEEEFEK